MRPPDTTAPVTCPDRRRLVGERASTRRLLDALTREVDEIVESGDATNTDDEHDPDGTTIAFERAVAIGLRDRARASLAEIDRAIEDLASGTYGTCDGCARPIPAARLDALPATRRCVSCAASAD